MDRNEQLALLAGTICCKITLFKKPAVQQGEKMGNKKVASPDKELKKKSVPAGNTGKSGEKAFVLLKFAPEVNRVEMLRIWESLEHVSHCDATKGDFDLVVTLRAKTKSALRGIIARETEDDCRIRDAVFLEANSYTLPKSKKLHGDASSYVFLEIEKEKADDICSILVRNDQVVSYDCIKGKYDIVLKMEGTSFPAINRSILTKIKPLEGVLRIKETPVIQLY